MTTLDEVLAWIGHTDVYLLDQLQRGRLRPPMRILDAGSGDGRNLEPFLRGGFDVHAFDADPVAIDRLRAHAADVAPHLPQENFRPGMVEATGYEDASFDAVVCIAVLHFARDRAHFDAVVAELFRVLRPGGLLFTRLATSIGIGADFVPLGDGRFRMGDGTDRFLADAAMLAALAARHGADEVDPLKTVVVGNLRAMTTWVVRKRG